MQNSFEIKWVTVAVSKLRIETQPDKIVPTVPCYADELYTLRRLDVFTPETVQLLLQIHPIYVFKRKHLQVIAGARSFRIAAACLDPSNEIPVVILGRKTTEEQLRQLRYLDLAVSPLLLSREGRASDAYQSINIPDLRMQSWKPPYNSSLNAFARMMGVSPPALCESSQRKTKKYNTKKSLPETEK